MRPRGRERSQATLPDWRVVAAGGAVFSMLVVVGGGGAVAYADTGTATSNATDSSSQDSSQNTDRTESTSPERSATTAETSQTGTEAREADAAESSQTSRLTSAEEQLDHVESPAGDTPSATDSTTESSTPTQYDPSLADSPSSDPSPPAQDNSTATPVDAPPDPPTTTPDTPTIPAEDNPTTDPTPPVQDTGSTAGPSSSTPEADSSSGSASSAPATPAATVTDDSTATTTTDPVSTITASDPAPAVDPTPAASVTSVVETVAAALGQPDLPAFEPSVVAPVVVTAVPMTVPLASVTVAPPGILQWFALLTWFQFQWLIQQQLNGSSGAPVLNRFDGRDTRLVGAVFQNTSTTAFLATQLPWLTTTLDALQGMPLAALQAMQMGDLPIDQAMLNRMSMTLAAETSSLPAIAKALTDQAHSRLGLLGSPCVGTFIRNVSLWALFTAAALGLLGLTSLTGLGTLVGFRQAKAGYALHASGLARFTGPGPLGVVREAGFVRIGSRRPKDDGPPRLRVIGTDLRDSA
ncbi:hypothetical protein MCHLDSM_06750 [Mycolicibacterium chlorophenolicum]|uniref:Uncharacterized protein n=2 Tax=Mycolicibacterium chlorophenolicum TaxID=37916 RepID=A0A0J6Y2V3_9MYCO|nr:hypothetical protein MCHLDSM_06750 [Mycolicibacterium chlorophenolicum]